MKVITSNPVKFRTSKRQSWGVYSSLDGKSSKTEIKAFQDWLDINYPTWVNGARLNKKRGYGNFGTSTSTAWNSFGDAYTKALSSVNKGVVGSTPTLPIEANGTPATNPNLTTTSPTGQSKAGYVFDKALGGFVKLKESGLLESLGALFGKTLPGATQQTWDGSGQNPIAPPPIPPIDEKKPMSTTTKVLIGVGGALVLGVIIYMLTKKSVPAS